MEFDLPKRKQNLVYNLKSNNQTLIGLYVGIWAGDGTQFYDKGYTIKICCHSENKKLIKFYKFVLSELFGKTVMHVANDKGFRAVLRFYSKFIYNFIYGYICYNGKKTYTVRLKNNIDNHSKEFLEGFMLGLILTDGYLKNKFYFNVTSRRLAKNAFNILEKWNFNPSLYVHDRTKYKWKDLYMVRLNKKESQRLEHILNLILKRLQYNESFTNLKYGGDGSAEI